MTFVNERIKTARHTCYSLVGAGLHGLNGLNPEVSKNLADLYQFKDVIWS